MLLFDDLYDEDEDAELFVEEDIAEAGEVGLEGFPDLRGIPMDVIELMSELSALNNNELPSDSDLERILQESPEMAEKLYGTMLENLMNGGLTPEMLGDDFPGPLPSQPRRRKRKKRKR